LASSTLFKVPTMTPDRRIIEKRVLEWRGSGATIEIVPVVSSSDTQEVVAPYLDKP
jgi:hypothetical protein